MNPRALAAWSGAATTLALISSNPVDRALLLLVTINVTMAVCPMDRSLRVPLLTCGVVSLGAVVINAAEAHAGTHVLVSLPPAIPLIGGPITGESLAFGAATAIGISGAIMAMAPLALALDPHELIAAMPRALDRTATVVATSVTLLPGLGRAATAVRDAQRLRGWEPGGVRSWKEILTPVVIGAMDNALRVAEAMEVRGFGGGRRTHWAPTPVAPGDWCVVVAASAAVAVAMGGRQAGLGSEWYPFPVLVPPVPSPTSIVATVLLLTPVFVWQRQSSSS